MRSNYFPAHSPLPPNAGLVLDLVLVLGKGVLSFGTFIIGRWWGIIEARAAFTWFSNAYKRHDPETRRSDIERGFHPPFSLVEMIACC